MKKLYYIFLATCIGFTAVQAQEVSKPEHKPSKAWEIGVGGVVTQLNRVYVTNLNKAPQGYTFDMKLRHAIYNIDLYVARELTKHLYVDLQGGIGTTQVYDVDNNASWRLFAPLSLGLQWRLAPYFNSKYIDPYFRIGLNAMYRDFTVDYSRTENIDNAALSWLMTNVMNKDANDTKFLLGASIGTGVNMWLNDNWGIGMHASYIYHPGFIARQRGVADAIQGGVRIIWRIGGESKKEVPTYIEKVVEVPVEKIVEVEVEKVIEKQPIIQQTQTLCELFNNIHFKFDKDDLTEESERILDIAADILKEHPDKHYLITGFTDIRGTDSYNLDLSRRRAAAVVKGLEKRGVPDRMLKSRGVGKKIAYAPYEQSHEVRKGDRKVTIEEIIVDEYWDFMPKRDY